ncbi:hypothetical protein ACF060_31395 [Streptomyces werraensis]|uniref:hypothetical protein n=1 Tax=Streptomyces werraensis TaxID=68284 RepID=UPI0036FBB66E
MTQQPADRPFANEPTEVLRAALGLATRHAEQAARFRPAQPGDALPAVVDLLRAELQHREETLLPPPEGPEYTPCSGCTHIEPEHRPDAGPCLVCDCTAYAPVNEAHPAEHAWAVELYDPDADEWVPGTRYKDRSRAVRHLDYANKIGPTWKDGTPTRRRLVRTTTTHTVERKDGDQA